MGMNFASYPSNPRFPLSVPQGAGPRCVRISLRQHCRDRQCLPIGFHVFQAGGGRRVGPGARGHRAARAGLSTHPGSEQLRTWVPCEV